MKRRSLIALSIGLFIATAAVSALSGQSSEAPRNPVAIPFQLRTPAGGVKLTGGALKQAYDNNVRYLLKNFSENDFLYVFRERDGNPGPPGKPFPWDKGGPRVTGSVAGLFLMGSGNAVRWEENQKLRERMNAVVAGIAACRQPNGFIMGYPEKETGLRENANYVRAWPPGQIFTAFPVIQNK